MKILACNSNIPLANSIASNLGTKVVAADLKRFQDLEISLEITDSIRGEDVFIIQSTSMPANDHLMELLLAADALRRSSARRITAVMPYFGYSRQDRQPKPRTPISAKVVANLIEVSGIDRVLTLDLHAEQIQGFFNIPVDNLYSGLLFIHDIKKHYDLANLVIVSPDIGGVVRSRYIAKKLGIELSIIDKRREKAGSSEVMNIIGDVKNKDCIIVDDIVDSAGTLCNAAEALLAEGAKSVSAYATHAVFSGPALQRLNASLLKELVVTDSINHQNREAWKKVRIVSIAELMAEAIKRITEESSVSSLFI